MAPILGYWNIRGLAQQIRLLLAYTETEFEDKRYNIGPAPEYDRSEWVTEKYSLGLDFPNLPYYIDGDVKLTQSIAILRYLGIKNNLLGSSIEEQNRVNLVEQQITDYNVTFVRLSYDPKFETLKVDFLQELPKSLELLSKFLGTRSYFAGEAITYVDFLAYEYLSKLIFLAPDIYANFDNLKQFIARIEALPAIAKYMSSDKYLSWPLNGDMASFGGRSDPK